MSQSLDVYPPNNLFVSLTLTDIIPDHSQSMVSNLPSLETQGQTSIAMYHIIYIHSLLSEI